MAKNDGPGNREAAAARAKVNPFQGAAGGLPMPGHKPPAPAPSPLGPFQIPGFPWHIMLVPPPGMAQEPAGPSTPAMRKRTTF